MVIIGYQGIGKSTLAKNNMNYIDLESSTFFVRDATGLVCRPVEWAEIYCNIAVDLSNQGYDVFVSSHDIVRKQLLLRGCDVCAIVPDVALKSEWIEKLHRRYGLSRSDKDYKAWKNAEDRFEENIAEIEADVPNTIKIDRMDYDLLFAVIQARCNPAHKNR